MLMIKYLLFLIFSLSFAFSQQYTIQQYLNIRGAGSPQFSADDNKIYFTQSVTGTSQVWMVDKPGSWPHQVTYFNDRVSSYNYNPKRDIILMEKDLGGSEYDQFFLLKPYGTGYEQITESKPKVLYSFGSWFKEGGAFTFLSNERNLFYYDIYKYNVDNRTTELLFQSDNSNYPSVISEDGNLMIVNRSYSSYDNDLILLNTVTKDFKIITLHDNYTEPAEFRAIGFSADSKKLYLSTNYRSEYYSLHEYNIAAGKMGKTDFPFNKKFKKHDLGYSVLSTDRTKIFLNFNENGYDKPMMYDLTTGKEIPLPGIFINKDISGVSFGNVTSKMLVGINDSHSPSVIYCWDYAANITEQVTYPSLAGIDPYAFVEPELIKFKSFDGLDIPAFIYYPLNSDNAKNLPCIISIHGGPEGQARYGFNSTLQYFVNAGYAVVEPNVRGSTGYGKSYAALDNISLRENSVKDIAWLVNYLITSGRIDSSRIAVYGGSYGGYMVLGCLTLYPELFAAGVDIVGISNFITFINNTAEYRRKNREGEYGSLERDSVLLKSISPINKVERINAPLMIIHGKNDPRVPVGEATQMYEAIINRGGTAELLVYDDEGHGIAKLKNRLDAYPKMVQFLDKYLK